MDIHIVVDGPDAAEAAEDLARWARDELAVTPDGPDGPDAPRFDPDADVLRGDPVAVAALVISLPGAVVSIIDLAQRTALVPRVRRLLAAVRRSRAHARLRAPSGDLDLRSATEEQVLRALTETQRPDDHHR